MQSSTSTTDTVYLGGLEAVTTTTTQGGQPTTSVTAYYGGLALAVNGALSYLASDSLGSAEVALDSNGNPQASQLYTPYGTLRYAAGTFPTHYAFTGYYADSATGLQYAHARYYGPSAGAFISADTTARGGLNRYAYVDGNPETYTDPSGHWSKKTWRKILEIVVGVSKVVPMLINPPSVDEGPRPYQPEPNQPPAQTTPASDIPGGQPGTSIWFSEENPVGSPNPQPAPTPNPGQPPVPNDPIYEQWRNRNNGPIWRPNVGKHKIVVTTSGCVAATCNTGSQVTTITPGVRTITAVFGASSTSTVTITSTSTTSVSPGVLKYEQVGIGAVILVVGIVVYVVIVQSNPITQVGSPPTGNPPTTMGSGVRSGSGEGGTVGGNVGGIAIVRTLSGAGEYI